MLRSCHLSVLLNLNTEHGLCLQGSGPDHLLAYVCSEQFLFITSIFFFSRYFYDKSPFLPLYGNFIDSSYNKVRKKWKFSVVVQLNHRTSLIAKIRFWRKIPTKGVYTFFNNALFLTMITKPLSILSIRHITFPKCQISSNVF